MGFCDDLEVLNEDYVKLRREVGGRCEKEDLRERMVIGSWGVGEYEIEGGVGM